MKLLIMLLTILSFNALAEAPPVIQRAPEPPARSPSYTGMDTDDLEPEVSIIKRDDAVVNEYRINGQLYMIKVEPVVGPPYYLFDSNGDGTLDIRRNELDPGLVVPRWMIFRW